MVQTKRETPGKTPQNKGVKLRTEEEEETAQESTQNEGQAAKQISIEVEGNRCTDQSGVEEAEVDQKVAEAVEANAMNREDKSTEPKISEKMVSAKKNRKRNAAKLVAGAENTGSLAAEMVDVDRFAGEQKSALIVVGKPRNEDYVEGVQKNEVIVDCNQTIGKYEHECVRKAKLEMESSQTVKKILEVAKADDSTAKQVELQQNESEKEIEVTIETEAKQKLSEKLKIDETVEKKIENEQREGKRKKRKRAKKVVEGEENSEQKSVPNAKLEMESPPTVKKILEAAEADESTAEKVELQQNESKKENEESKKENEVTVKTETKQELSEKMEIDEMVEKKIENEKNQCKRKKSKKRKRAKKVKGGEPEMVKKILEVAEADESTAKKVELQQNESEKEVKVTVKTDTKQELSEKMEINEMVEKKIENEESECKLKKSKKRKRAKKVKKGEPQMVKKILEVAEADESTAKKVELQQNESEKQIEVTMKTETKQKLSEKMEINEMVEKKVETEQSEGMPRKRKKKKRANKVKEGEVKKIREEDRDGKKMPLEVKKKTTVEEGHTKKKITEKEGEVKKITQGEGQLKTMKVDGTVEKKPENDQCKSEEGNGTCIEKEGQMKKTGQEEIITEEEEKKGDATEVIEMLVNSLTEDELREVLKSSALKEPGLLACINSVASRNKLKRTLYVKNLKCDTKSKTLREAFLQYGKIENAMVFADKESGKPLGFGFVEFRTKSSALSALRDPVKEINGQKCHCALKLPRRRSSNKSYMAIHGPRESVYPGILVPGGFIDPTSLGRGEYIHGQKEAVYPGIFGPGGFVDPTLLGRGEYVNPTVFVPMVNSAFSGHLNSQAVPDNIQFSNYWGRSNLHEY